MTTHEPAPMNIDQLIATYDPDTTPPATTDNPLGDLDQARKTSGYQAIMAKHLLLTLRTDAGLTLAEVAKRRGVTKAAAQQAENRDYDSMKLGSLIDQIRAIGFDVDAAWLIESLAKHLPERTLHTSDTPEPVGAK